MSMEKRLKAALAGVLVMMALVAGCGNNVAESSGGSIKGRASLGADMPKYFAGTDRALPTSAPRPVAGKNVWVLSCSSASPGCATLAQSAVDAGKAIGWNMTLVDGKFDPNTQSNQVRAAQAAGADGLITVVVDCPSISGALQDAVKGGMKVMSVYGYDCDNAYTKGTSLFSANLDFGPYKDYPGLVGGGFSRAIAAFISSLGGSSARKTEIIEFRENDLLVTRTIAEGFNAAIKACNCVVDTVTFTGQDAVTGKLQQKASAALSRFPNATVVMAPYDASVLLGIGAAVDQARVGGRKLTLTGGEGLAPNVQLIEKGTQQFAVGLPEEWAGWAIVDALDRAFAGAPQVDEGIGIKSIDKEHPAGCRPFVNAACVDFKAAYRKIWGVS